MVGIAADGRLILWFKRKSAIDVPATLYTLNAQINMLIYNTITLNIPDRFWFPQSDSITPSYE
jgi:hypothetical protein